MILICGGAGYIGSHTNKYLSNKGFKTIVFDNLCRGSKHNLEWGRFFKGDMAERSRLRQCFKQNKITSVLHFGAYAYVEESFRCPGEYYRNNVSNTLNLLDTMIEFGVNKLVFSSTSSIYGNPVRIPLDESHPINPVNPYARSKAMVEQILEDYDRSHGIRSVCLRYFNAAGDDPEGEIGERHEPETHLIPVVLQVAAGKRDHVEIFGNDYETPDGTCIRDYVHVNDLASGHLAGLRYLMMGRKSDSFNLGCDQGSSVRDVICSVERVTGKTIRVVESKRRPGDPHTLVSCSKKARRILGWRPQWLQLADIISTAWRWHSKQFSLVGNVASISPG